MDQVKEHLLARAKDPDDPLARMFAKVIAYSAGQAPLHRPGLGLPPERFSRLLGEYFPGTSAEQVLPGAQGEAKADCPARHMDEFDDLVQLFMEHAGNVDDDETVWLAHAIAAGCLSDNHLWQDLGLPNRQALSNLLQTRFARLFDKNTHNMKWKKFFYKQLCVKAEVNICKAPSCTVCDDHPVCFGPEEATPLAG